MTAEFMQLILLSLFATVTGLKYLFAVIRGVRPVVILKGEKKLSEKILESLPVAGTGLAVFLVLRKIFTPQICTFLSSGFTTPFYLQTAGFFLAFISFILLVGGYHALGSSWRVGAVEEETEELVTWGIFAYTRNPVYIFFSVFTTSLFFMNGDYALLVLSIIITISLHFQVLREEKILRKKYGTVYEEYLARVPRYFIQNR
jgi:protein-S-isoprenylcysteine O-methyltransferase Ste14